MCCSFFDGFSVKVSLTKELLQKSHTGASISTAGQRLLTVVEK